MLMVCAPVPPSLFSVLMAVLPVTATPAIVVILSVPARVLAYTPKISSTGDPVPASVAVTLAPRVMLRAAPVPVAPPYTP